MTILDTNVVSALMRRDGDSVVVGWLDRQPPESIWITAVTIFEVHFGLELLAQGRRRRQLKDEFARALKEDLEDRICRSSRVRRAQRRRSLPTGDKKAALSKFATRRSPASPWPGARRWQPATAGTSRTSGSRSSIRGRQAEIVGPPSAQSLVQNQKRHLGWTEAASPCPRFRPGA